MPLYGINLPVLTLPEAGQAEGKAGTVDFCVLIKDLYYFTHQHRGRLSPAKNTTNNGKTAY